MALNSNNVSATGSSNSSGNASNSNTVSANVQGVIAIRLLDSTATTEISELNFNLTPTATGTSATQRAVVDVSTSNPTGYKLYMQSDYQTKDSQGEPTGTYTTNLTHTDTEVSDVIPTSTSASTLYWNYINPLTNSGSENPVPSVIPPHGTPDKLDQYFNTTNSRQTPVDINVSVDTTIVSGTYENQLLFSAIANPEELEYSVTYDTDGGTPTIATQTDTAAAGTDSITLSSTIPAKTGYTFSHWQIVIPEGSGVTAACNANTTDTSICYPGDNITIHSAIDEDGDFVGAVGLKAIYEVSAFDGITTMQQMTPTICANAEEGETSALEDTRDGKTYTVKKLKDGNCWMTQNLALTGKDTAFTQADSDVSSSGFSMPTSASNTGEWCKTNSPACDDKAQYLDSNDVDYGVYYNWYTATAGSGTYNMTSGNANYSICPKGWKLPTGDPSGQWGALYNNYSSYTDMLSSTGPSLVLAGNRYGNLTYYQDNNGYYWSSTAYNNNNAYYLELNKLHTNVTPANYLYDIKCYGFSMRCLAKGYDVNISNTNTTSGTDKLNIPYGGSKTVTVTPSSGYYLSNVSCPSGYTCSGYSTGTSATGTQTVTVTNNNTDGGGTLAFTGTLAAPTSCATAVPVEPGSAPGTMNMYTSGGVQYVKLKTGASTSACYTKASRGTATWANASSRCPSGTGVPTQAEFNALISSNAYGTGGNLYTATGWSDGYWSSTFYDGSRAYYLYVTSSSAVVGRSYKTNSNFVVCIVR